METQVEEMAEAPLVLFKPITYVQVVMDTIQTHEPTVTILKDSTKTQQRTLEKLNVETTSWLELKSETMVQTLQV